MIFIWRLLIILLILTVLRWALGYIFDSGSRKVRTRARSQVQKSSKRMVKDPQCGMYLAPELALEMRYPNGNSVYFCSKECQENYTKAQAQLKS